MDPLLQGKIVVIGGEDLATAYGLLGCETRIASSPDELLSVLEEVVAADDVALILISQELSEPVRGEVDALIARTKKIISYIPTPTSEGRPIDMRKLLLKALGFG
ncbi:MAG: V-type ATP synthase subunit F [Fervidicoccaceae archaeon]